MDADFMTQLGEDNKERDFDGLGDRDSGLGSSVEDRGSSSGSESGSATNNVCSVRTMAGAIGFKSNTFRKLENSKYRFCQDNCPITLNHYIYVK
jgi:hypothetical protein